MPPSWKQLLEWCRHYYLTNSLINVVIHKMSEYPITETIIDLDETQGSSLKSFWENFLSTTLRYRAFQIEVGLDYFGYGICITTIHFPFNKILICGNKKCKHHHQAKTTRYKWKNLEYIIRCAKCGHEGPAAVMDAVVRDASKIRLERWNPSDVNVSPGFAGSDTLYTFKIPARVRTDITLGRKRILDSIPDAYIEAMKKNQDIAFLPENVFVMRRPILSQSTEGWGMPLILPVLKDIYYMQVLRKSQEILAQEHIVPLRVVFPQAQGATSDPYATVSLSNWKRQMQAELDKWRQDPNYIPILPFPIGNQSIGGDVKALEIYQELDMQAKQVVAGMGVPPEFVFGGMSFSGSNVSMRMLENTFISYRIDHDNMLNNFVLRRVAHFMQMKPVRAHMRRFKMADDLQRQNMFMNMNQAGKLSDRTFLSEADQDYDVEMALKLKELEKNHEYNKKQQINAALIQSEQQTIMAKAQAAQQAEQLANQQKQQAEAAAAGGVAPTGEGQPAGAEGEMVAGGQTQVPGMPDEATVSMENAQQPAQTDDPILQNMQTQGMQGGGMSLVYLARRFLTAYESMQPNEQQMALSRVAAMQPQLHAVIVRMLQQKKGSQEDPLSATQSPLPQQKPSRRPAPVGA